MSTRFQGQVKVTAIQMPSFTPVRPKVLRRECAWRGTQDPAGEFAEPCGKRLVSQPPLLQAKLTIGQPNDQYEQEADQVADRVMRMPEPRVQRRVEPEEEEEETPQAKPLARQITPLVQRQVEPEEEEEDLIQTKRSRGHTPQADTGITAQVRSLRGGGQPLPTSARNFFEPRFGHDFSQVRIHTNRQAAEAAQAVKARAFTLGRDVVFGAGQYAPDTPARARLLAHELTHVVQQNADMPGRVTKTAGKTHIQRKTGEEESGTKTPYKRSDPTRFNFCFIMGTTRSFYRLANWFAEAYYASTHDIYHVRSLCGIMQEMENQLVVKGERSKIGQVIIISHANSAGQISFPIMDTDKTKWFAPGDIASILRSTLSGQTAKFGVGCATAIAWYVQKASDEQTQVIIKGCNLGQNQAAIDALRELFGGQATVTAPAKRIVYGTKRIRGRLNPKEVIAWMVQNGYLPPEAKQWAEDEKEDFVVQLVRIHWRRTGIRGVPSEYLKVGKKKLIEPSDPGYSKYIKESKPEER